MSTTTNLSYAIFALIWNLAIMSVYAFMASWLFGMLGSVIGGDLIRDNAYALGFLTTISMFGFGVLAFALSKFVKCGNCGSHIIKAVFPYFISFKRPNCMACEAKVI